MDEVTDPRGKKIEFAPQIDITQYEDIAVDFMPAILGHEYHDCWLSDESTPSDFFPKDFIGGKDTRWGPEAMQEFSRRVQERYGVDISDMDDPYLVEVFQRIRILKG